ncbi:MAG: rubrerythrin family protein [Lentimicrobiaceae bacterium]|jgi:rubrerythrin|nr:rubrerythrin family protein [Lentimicrobiaceae bacterium]
MESIKGTQTEKNLLKAFAGESQASNRYTFFAKKAKEEGYEQIAAIFIETAAQEQTHAKIFFKFLEGGPVEITATYPAGKIGTTTENLLEAAEGEKEEWTMLYKEFEEVALKEGFKQIATKFRLIQVVEKRHEERYRKLLKNIEEGNVFQKEKKVKWVCRKCGYIYESEKALKNCPACEHPQAYFEEISENY